MNMKNVSSKALLPFALLSSAFLLSACDQMNTAQTPTTDQDDSNATSNRTENTTSAPLSSGNMFYIVRDVADLQLKAGQYIEQLNQTKSELQTALDTQDPQQLQILATQLQQQLQGFNQTLSSLDLKTQEIDTIRQNLLTANQQVLASPFLNGQVDLSKVDFKKLEQQMGNIQTEMLKLAAMILQGESNQLTETTNTAS
jgi:predicted small secreted protein